jgi:transposase-like protein
MNEIQSKYTTSLALLIKYRALRKQGQFHEDVCKALGVASSTMYQWNNPKTSFLLRDVPVLTKGRSGYSQEDRNAAVKAYYDMIGKGANMSQVCALLGIDLKTLKSWIDKSIHTYMEKSTAETSRVFPFLALQPEGNTYNEPVLFGKLLDWTREPFKDLYKAYDEIEAINQRLVEIQSNFDNFKSTQFSANTQRVTALEHRLAQNATTQHVAALTERVQSLEHAAQDAHQALYDARERLLALETRDTEPTPFHAVDRTYVLVIAILVITVAITLVTVLL